MFKKSIPGRTPFVIEHPIPTIFPEGIYEDSSKCIGFLKESNHPFHMLLHLNNYIKRKFKKFIQLCEDKVPLKTLYEEMAKLLALFEEVGRANYYIDGVKELIYSEMFDWV